MGTLRFFEEVVSFKIRRTFGFADYKRNFRPVPDTKASRDAKTAGRSAGERKRPMRPEILGEQVRTGLAATSDKATEFNHFQTFQPKTPWKN